MLLKKMNLPTEIHFFHEFFSERKYMILRIIHFDIFFQHISIMIGTCFFHFRGASPSGDTSYAALGRQTSHFDLLGHACRWFVDFTGKSGEPKCWLGIPIYIYIYYIFIYAKRSKIWFLVCHKAWSGFSPSTWKKRNNYISARFLVGMHPLN